jgi:hypothetical protein
MSLDAQYLGVSLGRVELQAKSFLNLRTKWKRDISFGESMECYICRFYPHKHFTLELLNNVV